MPPTLLACGSNAASHLSINHPDDVSTLTPTVYHPSLPPIPDSSTILDLVSTSAHSLLLLSPSNLPRGERTKNILLGAGTNNFGQLGPRCALWDNVKPEPRWKSLNLINSAGIEGDWEPGKIASTWTTSFVVYQRIAQNKTNGESGSGASEAISRPHTDEEEIEQIVLSCGSNDFGELGSSTQTPIVLDAPAEIPISQSSQKPTIVDLGLKKGEKIQLIKGGQRHVIVVIDGKDGQRVIGWGASRKGELDASTLSSNHSGDTASAGSSSKGKGKGKGKATSRPNISPPTQIDLPIPSGETIIDISLGASHTLALLSNGRVLAWGSNLKGQIANIHELSGIQGISSTWGGSYFLNSSNEILSQGSNSHSQLLRGVEAKSEIGKIDVPNGYKVEKIVAGSEHSLVHMINDKGEDSLWSGGWNEHGNLALGDQNDRSTLHKVALNGKGKGKIKGVWGGCASTWIWTSEE